MGETTLVLQYGSDQTARRLRRWLYRGTMASVVLIAGIAGWNNRHDALEVWTRYQAMSASKPLYRGLATHAHPRGTVVLEPSSAASTPMLPAHHLIYGDDSNGKLIPIARGLSEPALLQWVQSALPGSAVLYQQWNLHGGGDDQTVAFVHERKTASGTNLVLARVRYLDNVGDLGVWINESQVSWSGFPSFQSAVVPKASYMLWIKTRQPPRTPVVVLAGEADAHASKWSLPLIIDGRSQRVQFDLSGTVPAITSSFGTVDGNAPRIDY